MHFTSDEGFIIRRRNIGDADKIITIFSQNNGKINVTAKGVRKITSRRAALLEPFNHIKFHAVQSHKRHVLTEVELINSFESDKKDLESYKKIFVISELLDVLCGEEQPHGTLYDKVLEFAYMPERFETVLDFKTDMLIHLGYWNKDKKFVNDDAYYRYIESIIEKKLKSRSFSF